MDRSLQRCLRVVIGSSQFRNTARAFYADSDWQEKHLPAARAIALKSGDNAKVSLKIGAE
jgi:hypothetical protein